MHQSFQDELWDSIVSRLNTMGFVINLVIPAVILLVGFLIGTKFREIFSLNDETLTMIRWVLIGISVGEVIIAVIIKKRLFGNLQKYFPEGANMKARVSLVVKMMMVIHTLAATPAIYGLLYYILGGSIEGFMLMIILNLIGYQLCRGRQSDFDNLHDILLGHNQG